MRSTVKHAINCQAFKQLSILHNAVSGGAVDTNCKSQQKSFVLKQEFQCNQRQGISAIWSAQGLRDCVRRGHSLTWQGTRRPVQGRQDGTTFVTVNSHFNRQRSHRGLRLIAASKTVVKCDHVSLSDYHARNVTTLQINGLHARELNALIITVQCSNLAGP